MLLLLSAFCFLLFFGCSKQSTNNTSAPGPVQAQLLEGSAYLPANAPDPFTYRIQISDNRYLPDSIVCEVRKPDGTALPAFGLYDDGGVFPLSGPAYASSSSRDIAAHDGQYTRQINGQLLANSVTGAYQFHFTFYGGVGYEMANNATLTVNVQNAGPCLITSYPQDSVFAECFAPETLTVRVAPTPADRADSVRVRLREGTTVLAQADFAAAEGDTVWRVSLDPTFFGCTGTAQNAYTLEYAAHTQFGMSCVQSVNVASFVNARPSLSDPTLPDTLLRPAVPTDTNFAVITARLHDCELVSSRDYAAYTVHYDTRRSTATDWFISSALEMFDDTTGSRPDAVPRDGIYSGGIRVVYDTTASVLYYFRFYAIDCAPPHDTSAYLMDSVRLVRPEPSMMMTAPGKDEEITRGKGDYPVLGARQ
ncbi:MAG TPA: hypothetical protein VGL38_06830 [bacterium]